MSGDNRNVIFLTGTLAVGKDGVADYTMSLARMLTSRIGSVATLGIQDNGVVFGHRYSAGTVEHFRFGARLSGRETASRILELARPSSINWISLQFVPYAFGKYGLPLSLFSLLVPLRQVFKMEIMLHELWIGLSAEYGCKDRIIGWMQKSVLLSLLARLKPEVVHTSNNVYLEVLRENKICARKLPIFSSLEQCAVDEEWWTSVFKQLDTGNSVAVERWLLVGMFGTIQGQFEFDSWIPRIVEAAQSVEKRVALIQFGFCSGRGMGIWKSAAERYKAVASFIELGPQPEARVDTILSKLDCGVSTSPWALVEKSSTVAAMRERRLPVLVPRNDWKLLGRETPQPTDTRSLVTVANIHDLLVKGKHHSAGIYTRAEAMEEFVTSIGVN